jgi:predicted RNase H-like nuclease (RuvC/YqgF family)
MNILRGDTIYKCCKFIELKKNENNRYTIYLRVRAGETHRTKYISCIITMSYVGYGLTVTTRATDVEMLKLLGTMITYTQQRYAIRIRARIQTRYRNIMETFLKEGYYLDKNVFKFLKLCMGVRIRVCPRLYGYVKL